jgi:peptidoglycan/xylan/chitin deacetylase (PgdA/CDA1 family)
VSNPPGVRLTNPSRSLVTAQHPRSVLAGPPREILRGAYAAFLQLSGAVIRARAKLAEKALVLMYHRVVAPHDVPADIDPGMYVTTDAFERHLQYLAAHHEVVTLEALFEWLVGRRQFAKIPCAITFDDGWRDNYEEAFPLLTRYGLPATIFLITDHVGTPAMVTWAQVHEMEAAGIQFGSHTVTHPVLTTIDDQSVRDELVRSKERLVRDLRRPVDWFCYPKGAYDQRSLAVAREHYAAAVSTEEGPVSIGDDLHHVHRIGIHHDVTRTTALFACRLVSLV